MASSTTIIVGSMKTGPDIPTSIRGMTVCYTTRRDIAEENRFAIIDNDSAVIRTADDKEVRFGYDVYGDLRPFIDFDESSRMIVERDYAEWLDEKTKAAQGAPDRGSAADVPQVLEDHPPIARDPSAHLLSFFVTCLVITIVVCLGRIYGRQVIENFMRLLG